LIGSEIARHTAAKIAGVESRALVDGVVTASVGLNWIRSQRNVVASKFLTSQWGSTNSSARAVTTARSASTSVVGSAEIGHYGFQTVVDVGSGRARPNSVLDNVELGGETQGGQLSGCGQTNVSVVVGASDGVQNRYNGLILSEIEGIEIENGRSVWDSSLGLGFDGVRRSGKSGSDLSGSCSSGSESSLSQKYDVLGGVCTCRPCCHGIGGQGDGVGEEIAGSVGVTTESGQSSESVATSEFSIRLYGRS